MLGVCWCSLANGVVALFLINSQGSPSCLLFQEFVFLGGADDLLEVEVRNKFSGTRPAFSRFLGKLTVPLVDLFGCQRNRFVIGVVAIALIIMNKTFILTCKAVRHCFL